MLKLRLLTAAILIPLFVWGTLSLPTAYFSLLIGAVVLGGAWEWSRLVGISRLLPRVAYVLFLCGLMLAVAQHVTAPGGLREMLVIALLWWLLAVIRVFHYHQEEDGIARTQRTLWEVTAGAASGILVLIPAWLALTVIHGNAGLGPVYVLFLFILIWGADTGAYFAGRRWGRTRLAAQVSPGKSWEGVAGGMLVVAVIAVAGDFLSDMGHRHLLRFVLICLVTAAFSVVGDLLESLYKRRAGVKDSGSLLPGHGGIMDRIDSMTAAAPVFLAGLIIAGIYA